MSVPEKQHVSRKARMKHPSNLDSFMDETDREVMSLTDRAFKSLCIGDEAVYNDSELLLSPVDCHKPLAEEISKKPRENSAFDVKKHGAHRPNGVYNTPWQVNKNTTKMSSLFATFVAKKNNGNKMTNGDSWDKSAMLSIQTELSSDYKKHFMDDNIYEVKSHRKPSEKGAVDQPIRDKYNSSGKLSKNQHGKSTKLRKLNSKNFFLHSESSPFQSWGDLNRFGLENMEMFPCYSPAGLYCIDSPLYRELNSSDRLNVPEPNKRETSQSTSPLEPQKSKLDSSQPLKTVSPLPEQHSELNTRKLPDLQPQVLRTSSGSFQRCQSEGDLYAPWRKKRNRAKGVLQPFISSPSCEKSNAGDQSATQNKNEVRTVEEAVCVNSTPFSISQLLTPMIPSRQGTGTSEILQCVHSPATVDIQALCETEIPPSPDIKREGYKSKASSLLFNLKDNRKRVKTTYSPPKFKGFDTAEQNKLSPLVEQDVTKSVPESPEITDSKTALDVQKHMYPKSPETADIQSSQSCGHTNSTLPDDFLGLSLLQDGNIGSPIKSLKAKKNPLAKVTYPSLHMYQKTSPVEVSTKAMPVDVSGSNSTISKSAERMLGKENLPENHNKKLQRRRQSTNPEINNANHEYTHRTQVETADKVLTRTPDPVACKEKYIPAVLKNPSAQQDAPSLSGSSRNQDKLHTEEIFKAEERAVRHKQNHSKEPKAMHLFTARQNNYIKNQRYRNVDDDDDDDDADAEGDIEEYEYWRENGISTEREELRTRELNVDAGVKDKGKVQGNIDDPYITGRVTNDGFTKNSYSVPPKNDLVTEQKLAKNEAFSMKGNTSAKIALFTVKGQPSTAHPVPKKSNIVKDRYELATMALEKRIAERERRKKQSKQDQPAKEDDTPGSGEKETPGSVIPHRQGQRAVSDFTLTSQNVRSMSDTNHGEYHVPEVKLAGPYKQEGAAKYSPSRLIYPDRDRSDRHDQHDDPSNIRSLDDGSELKETVLMSQDQTLIQESSTVQDYICDNNKNITVGEDESSVQKKKGFQKPEASRNEPANFQAEDKAINERQRKEGQRDETFVKHEEPLGTEVKISNLPKDKGAAKGHASSLLEKFNKEQVMLDLNAREFLGQGDDFMGYPNDDLKHKAASPTNILVFPEAARLFEKNNHKAGEADSDSKIIPDKDARSAMEPEGNLGEEIADGQGIQNVNKNVPKNKEERNNVMKTDRKTFDVLRETSQQDKSKCLTDHFGESDEPGDETEKTPTLNLFNPGSTPVDRTTLYNILNQAVPSYKQLDQGKQLMVRSEDSHKPNGSPSFNKPEIKCENLDLKDSCSSNNHEKNPCNSSVATHSSKDVEKGGLVHCFIDSAHNLTPTCQSNASSPTLGKPALFKVKDNTFSASPVTKTVKPILHKTVAGVAQPWSPRESLSGSERGEEDPDLYKDFEDVQSLSLPSTPVRITQPDLSAMRVVPHLSSQSTKERETKGHMDSSTVAEKEDLGLESNKNSIKTEIEELEMNAGDTVEELAFNTAHTEGSKVPSERTPSACSGTENQVQGKPPAVPPKTEKAMRRAMKLTTKRIQKAEAKTKSERGLSSEKGSCHEKHERRHQSSDKVLSEKSCQQKHNIDRDSNDQNARVNDGETAYLPKSHKCERHAMHQNKPTSRKKEKVTIKKLQHRCHSSLNSTDSDAKRSGAEKRNEYHSDQLDAQNIHVDSERLGRTTEKSLSHKLYRRAQSLDRFSSGKHTRLCSSEDPLPQTAPLQQISQEHAYGSPANNIVPQAFPMTQRKLLQDLDSGQYFVVDMPVQVKTKTFFDPETGHYVQLPVQSLDGSVPRAQSVEVVNAPSLMLYHGFVPVAVPSLP